jgi:hypothetical protein
MRIVAKASHIRADLADLRRSFPADADFARALRAVTSQLRRLGVSEAGNLGYKLDGWSRLAFSSGNAARAELRVIFRAYAEGFELRAFGHRSDPESVYLRARARR